MNLTMFQILLLSGLFCAILPLLLFRLKTGKRKKLYLIVYCFVIIYFTLGNRLLRIYLGDSSFDLYAQCELSPFWSYKYMVQDDIRWQIYLNVFLFIPLGFLLPWCLNTAQHALFVVTVGLLFSFSIEIVQYVFHIGLCETDDVIHNTLGTIIGYRYWLLLSKCVNFHLINSRFS